MPQMTDAEMRRADRLMRGDSMTPVAIWRLLKKSREVAAKSAPKGQKRKASKLSSTTVYAFCNGETHPRQRVETRGRDDALTKGDVRSLMQARRRLIQKRSSQRRVTYAEVIEEAALEKDVSQRTVEDALREQGIRYRPARKKIYLSDKDAKARVNLLSRWVKKPKKFWSTCVHAYIDAKAWPAPSTAAQRAKYKASKVTGHLRLAKEGIDRGFTTPRQQHSFIGVPTIKVCAAVAKDRVIMWHDYGNSWNGAVAADMYKGPLLAALKRTWGDAPFLYHRGRW